MLKRFKSEWQTAQNLLSYVFIQATGQALAVILPLAIAKVFSQAEFARYSLCEMVIFFFVTILLGTLKTPFIVHGSEERSTTGRMNKTLTSQCILLSGCVVIYLIVNILFGRLIIRFADITSSILIMMALGFLGLATKDFISGLFLATGQRKTSGLVDLIFGASSFILVGIFILFNWMTISTVFLIYFLASLIVVITLVSTSLDFKSILPFEFDAVIFKNILNFNVWLLIGFVALYITNWSSLAILRSYVSLDDIGTYNLASKIFKGSLILVSMVPIYFLPFLSENIANPASIQTYLKHKRPRIMAIGIAGFTVLFIGIPYVFEILYPGKYIGVASITRLLLIAGAISLSSSLYGPLLSAAKQYKFLQMINVGLIVVNLGANFVLIPRYGLYGAAIATIITQLYFVMAYEVFFRRVLKPQLNLNERKKGLE